MIVLQSYDRTIEIEKFVRFLGKSSMDAAEQLIKDTASELSLLEYQLIETEKLRDQELKAYQSTVKNLRLKLDSTTAILPELQKVVEDVVETDKPKRKRNTKK